MRKFLIMAPILLVSGYANAQNILPKTTYFYDSYGNISGSASSNPVTGQTTFSNQYGSYEGSVNRIGPNQYGVTDANGDYQGSINGPMFGE